MGTKKITINYRFMNILLIIVGAISMALLFLPGFDILSFLLALSVLGGLMSQKNNYAEQDRRHLQQSVMTAVEWLLLILLAAFALIASSRWLGMADGVVSFLSDRWPSLIVSVMCVLLGVTGLLKTKGGVSA